MGFYFLVLLPTLSGKPEVVSEQLHGTYLPGLTMRLNHISVLQLLFVIFFHAYLRQGSLKFIELES